MMPIEPGAPRPLARIRERKLVQWGLAYVAGAWAFLEVTALVGEQFGWPAWIGRALIILTIVALPAALILAWYHGERGRQRVSGPELLMLTALLVIAGAAVALVRGRSGPEESAESIEESARLADADEASAVVDDTAPSPLLPPKAPDLERSIAVLPFTSLSADAENNYFADAITEEILNALAKLRDLRVTSRTSVMRYKDTEKSLPEIADELGVSKVLEGSVRRQGDRVRIIAQLADARTDTHLWSEAYQREMTDLFQVQVEIAEEIAGALKTELTSDERERIAAGRTGELTAYDLYLRARELIQTEWWRDPDSVRQAVRLLRRALEIDPDYARAHAALAEAFAVLQPFEGLGLGDSALVYSQRAVELEPDLAEAHSARCRALAWNELMDEALESCRRAVELQPSLLDAILATGMVLSQQGRLDEAVSWFARAVELSPGTPPHLGSLGDSWLALDDSARAYRYYEERLRLAPEDPESYRNLFNLYLSLGHLESAARELDRLEALAPGHHLTLVSRANLATERGRWSEAIEAWQALRTLMSGELGPPIELALAYARAGEEERADSLIQESEAEIPEREVAQYWWDHLRLAQLSVLRGEERQAIAHLERAFDMGYRDAHIGNERLMEPLRDDPRFQRFVRRMDQDIDRMREAAIRREAERRRLPGQGA